MVFEGDPFHFSVLIQIRAASVNSGPVTGHQEKQAGPRDLLEESQYLLKGVRREGAAMFDKEGEKAPLRTSE